MEFDTGYLCRLSGLPDDLTYSHNDANGIYSDEGKHGLSENPPIVVSPTDSEGSGNGGSSKYRYS